MSRMRPHAWRNASMTPTPHNAPGDVCPRTCVISSHPNASPAYPYTGNPSINNMVTSFGCTGITCRANPVSGSMSMLMPTKLPNNNAEVNACTQYSCAVRNAHGRSTTLLNGSTRLPAESNSTGGAHDAAALAMNPKHFHAAGTPVTEVSVAALGNMRNGVGQPVEGSPSRHNHGHQSEPPVVLMTRRGESLGIGTGGRVDLGNARATSCGWYTSITCAPLSPEQPQRAALIVGGAPHRQRCGNQR